MRNSSNKNPLRIIMQFQRFSRWVILQILAPILGNTIFRNKKRKSVLFSGQAYYNSFYLSRSLRIIGWQADVFNWDLNPGNQMYYHGEDYSIKYSGKIDIFNFLRFYIFALIKYDIFHFANKDGMHFGGPLKSLVNKILGEDGFEIRFLKALGKKIVYSYSGCLDGVSQTSFSKWGPEDVCSTICIWKNQPLICSDKDNLRWGKFRNEMADYICTLGGNRVDYNDSPIVHETPEFYCLEPNIWHPEIDIPSDFKLPMNFNNKIRIFHSVGNHKERTNEKGINIKSSHIYLPLIKQLQSEGLPVELINVTSIHNIDVRFYQAQADIVVDMLSFGWYGANIREALMLGKPCICYLRPEWLESIAKEIPDFVSDIPIISATPNTVEPIIRQLIADKNKRIDVGKRSREFALKWHSSDAAARRFNKIYCELLGISDDVSYAVFRIV